ncbi:rod shape-determining protein MreC [Solilutibacter silvestris]
MSSYSGPAAPRAESIADTLRLLAYLAACIVLMAFDRHGGLMQRVHASLELVAQPVWKLAGLPGRIGVEMRNNAVTRSQLIKDNADLRNAVAVSGARMARLQAEQAENERLRSLLGAAQRGRLDVQLAPILDIDLDPTHQRLVLDAGSNQGVHVGQVVIDGGGILGQVTSVQPITSTVLLITDPDHAIPVEVVRTGIRLIVYGRGNRLVLGNIPRSADIKVGDRVQTSGLGGRFPAGFPVGAITKLKLDDSRAFLEAELMPAAQPDRGHEVLLLRTLPAAPVFKPVELPERDTKPAHDKAKPKKSQSGMEPVEDAP